MKYVLAAENGGVDQLLQKISDFIIEPLIGFFIVLALVYFVWGVIEFLAGADNEEKRKKGKEHIIWGILGLFIILAVAGILKVISGFWSSLR